jgi:hypothetical protein
MQIEVEENPNCRGSEQFVFLELGKPRPVSAIRTGEGKKEALCDVVAVEAGGKFGRAFAVKIADSGAGYAYLIYGGVWGIRLRSNSIGLQAWDLLSEGQWGEPFKIYGSEDDILYADK